MTRRRALAIGCGGTRGLAWTADVLVGTSAGSEIVAALGSGRTPQDLLDALDGAPGADPVLAVHVAADPGTVPPVPARALAGPDGWVEPGAKDLAAMGADFMDLGRREATLAAARRHVPDRVAAAISTGPTGSTSKGATA